MEGLKASQPFLVTYTLQPLAQLYRRSAAIVTRAWHRRLGGVLGVASDVLQRLPAWRLPASGGATNG